MTISAPFKLGPEFDGPIDLEVYADEDAELLESEEITITTLSMRRGLNVLRAPAQLGQRLVDALEKRRALALRYRGRDRAALLLAAGLGIPLAEVLKDRRALARKRHTKHGVDLGLVVHAKFRFRSLMRDAKRGWFPDLSDLAREVAALREGRSLTLEEHLSARRVVPLAPQAGAELRRRAWRA
jgi:hypothetical protein